MLHVSQCFSFAVESFQNAITMFYEFFRYIFFMCLVFYEFFRYTGRVRAIGTWLQHCAVASLALHSHAGQLRRCRASEHDAAMASACATTASYRLHQQPRPKTTSLSGPPW